MGWTTEKIWFDSSHGKESVHRVQTGAAVELAFDSMGKSSPITGLEWPKGFQEVKVPTFHDNGIGWW